MFICSNPLRDQEATPYARVLNPARERATVGGLRGLGQAAGEGLVEAVLGVREAPAGGQHWLGALLGPLSGTGGKYIIQMVHCGLDFEKTEGWSGGYFLARKRSILNSSL